MKYEKEEGEYNYYVAVGTEYGVTGRHPLELRESDRVLFKTINKRQWYDFIHYCMVKYDTDALHFDGYSNEFKALWDEFNNNGSI